MNMQKTMTIREMKAVSTRVLEQGSLDPQKLILAKALLNLVNFYQDLKEELAQTGIQIDEKVLGSSQDDDDSESDMSLG